MTAPALDSRVSSVTVYRQGARVVRVAEITRDGNEFPEIVRVAGLPLCIDDSSVRARVTALGEADAAPVAADLRVVLELPAVDEDLPSPDDADVEQAGREVTRCRATVAVLEEQLAVLMAIKTPQRPDGAEGEPPIPSPTATRLAGTAFLIDRARAVTEELQRARNKLDAAERALDRANEFDRRRAGARQTRTHELRKTVIIGLRDRAAGDRARIELEYVVPGARWAPAYSVRLDTRMERASLSMRAVVAQHTGEDWTHAALTLSTAEPSHWTELPELASLRIGKRQPTLPKAGWRSPPVGADALYADYDRVFESLEVPSAAPAVSRAAAEEESPLDAAAAQVDLAASEQLAGRYLADDEFEITDMPAVSLAVPPPNVQAPMRRGRSLFGFASGAASHDLAPAPMSPSPGGVMSHVEEPVREVRARDELLGYGALRMAAPHDSGRGVLARTSDAERYLELLVATKVEVSVNVLTVIAASFRVARDLDGLEFPAGHGAEWTGHYDYAYVAEHPVDVPSGDGFHSIPLVTCDTTSELLYVSVPRESSDVFRTAKVQNPMPSPLLAGPVDVYVGDGFLLTSEVEFTTPRSGFVLGLGVEQGIKLARNTRFREETSGLLGGSLELQHQIHVEIQNRLDRDVDLEVRDRVPTTREDEEDVKVVINKVSPAWDDYEPPASERGTSVLRGGHRWRTRVAAGGTQELRVAYTVELSSKLELVGGNRRED